MPKPLSESTILLEATASTDQAAGVLEVEFITPGWGSSGYYSREVVEAAAPLFAVGTHMYFDHPSATEASDRPERSVRDLAAVIVEAGSVDKTTGGVRGKVKPLAPYRELLTDEAFATNVGLSIRGSATDIVIGEAEGRKGPIIEGLADIASVDFVTRAGRGGRVLQVLESARPEEVVGRAIAHGVAEATADERRTQLSDAVRTAYAGNDRYAWVQDFDDTTVWFQASAENERSRTWQQAYTVADDDMSVSLTGERIEVRPVTKYVPVNNPAGRSTTTEETTEVTMAEIKIEETEHKRLLEADGRVKTLESERDTLKAENTELKEARARDQRRTDARKIVEASDGVFDELQVAGLLADLPVKEDSDDLDVDAFTQTVAEAAAKQKAAAGAGTVTGFGGNSDTATSTTESATPRKSAWGRPLTEQKGA